MVSDRAAWWAGDCDPSVVLEWLKSDLYPVVGYIDSEYGPVSELEDAWFTQWVASLDYPPVQRPEPLDGQGEFDWEEERQGKSAWGPEGRPW